MSHAGRTSLTAGAEAGREAADGDDLWTIANGGKAMAVAADEPSGAGKGGERLSEEQIRVVALIAEGRTDEAIARELGLSLSTVRRRLRAAAETLGVQSRVGVAVRAAKLGLIDPK